MGGDVGSGLGYVTSAGGIFKMAEAAVLVIAAGAVGYFLKEGPDADYDKKDRIEFFVAAAGIALVVVLAFFLIFLTGIHKKINIVWTKTTMAVFVLMGILMLVASAMLAEVYKTYDDDNLCDIWKKLDLKTQCKHLIVGVVCGFIAVAVFIADAVVHFKM